MHDTVIDFRINCRAGVIFLLLGFLFFSHNVGAELKYTVDVGMSAGGEKLEPASRSSIDAGEGTRLAVGLEYLTQDGGTLLSVASGFVAGSNRKSAGCSIVCAHPPPDQRVDFDYDFIETVILLKLGESPHSDWAGHWFGAGLTYADSPEYKYEKLSEFGTGSIKYKSSVGYVVEYLYRPFLAYLGDNVGTVGLRYTEIEFESSQTKVDGSNYMIFFRFGF